MILSGILTWLNSHVEEPLKRPVSGDTITFFDNNQVVGKKWGVSLDSKVPSSVIMTVIHITANGPEIRRQPHLSPNHSAGHELSNHRIVIAFIESPG